MEKKLKVSRDETDREARIAEERMLFAAQKAMQRLVNAHGLRYRDLARRMGVSEARVSQMFGDDPTNLTLRSLAKVFHTFGEEVVISSKTEFDRALAEAAGRALVFDATWHVPAPDFVLWDHSATQCDEGDLPKEFARPAGTLKWALADDAQSRMRIAG